MTTKIFISLCIKCCWHILPEPRSVNLAYTINGTDSSLLGSFLIVKSCQKDILHFEICCPVSISLNYAKSCSEDLPQYTSPSLCISRSSQSDIFIICLISRIVRGLCKCAAHRVFSNGSNTIMSGKFELAGITSVILRMNLADWKQVCISISFWNAGHSFSGLSSGWGCLMATWSFDLRSRKSVGLSSLFY